MALTAPRSRTAELEESIAGVNSRPVRKIVLRGE